MPSILQFHRLDYTDIAETMFWGGSSLIPVSDTEFRTQNVLYTLTFKGTGLTYDAQNRLTGGVIDQYSLQMNTGSGPQSQLLITSNFDLLTAAEARAAFDAAIAGDLAGAVDMVTASWTAEYFSHTNYSGGPLYGYGGDDGLSGGVADDIIFGRGGDDGITLNSGDDAGFGGAGNDRLYGRDGRDTLYGGDGNDQLRGDDGNDWLHGDADNDSLHGGKGHDRMYGGTGDDALLGFGGDDRGWGGTGDDFLRGDLGRDRLWGEDGNDTLEGGKHDDILSGGAGADILLGETGADQLAGGAGDDTLRGGRGADTLTGGAGDDTLSGGGENDVLDTIGGGNDLLRGGLGADSFVIRASAGDTIRIADFADGLDQISLSDFGFGTEAAALAAASETAAGHVVFDLEAGQTLRVLNTTLAELAGDLLV